MESSKEKSNVIIETDSGPIYGYIDEREEGTYYIFKRIPYAAPPIGPLRFLPPHPVKRWTNVIDCTKDLPYTLNKSCPKAIGPEDCLYIEVHSPNIRPSTPLPVMFWIGSYLYAYDMDYMYDPTLIVDQNIVFVRCSFRLGPFGFLSINDFTAPGNCGLKDVVMAMKWVQKNIIKFGGDPNNVTIFGNGTGGAIAHLMMLSPMASGLFHKAILQSACALNNWSLAKNPSHATTELARELGITTTNKVEIVEQLRSISTSDIVDAFIRLNQKLTDSEKSDSFDAIFKPCIEDDFEGLPAFLTKSPPLIIKSGNYNRVPLIIGSNNIEASVLQFVKQDFYNDFQKYNENVHLLVPKSLAGEAKLSKHIGQQLLKFYLGGEDSLREDTQTQYLQLMSDYYFLYYVNKTVQLHVQSAPECPIFYYVLNCTGDWSVPKPLDFVNTLAHCTETPFLFRLRLPGQTDFRGSRDCITTRKRVIKMWTNFAKLGHPTPDENDLLLQVTWDPVENKDRLNYLSIGAELTKGRNPFHDRMTFWDQLHKEHTFLRALVHFHDLGVSW